MPQGTAVTLRRKNPAFKYPENSPSQDGYEYKVVEPVDAREHLALNAEEKLGKWEVVAPDQFGLSATANVKTLEDEAAPGHAGAAVDLPGDASVAGAATAGPPNDSLSAAGERTIRQDEIDEGKEKPKGKGH